MDDDIFAAINQAIATHTPNEAAVKAVASAPELPPPSVTIVGEPSFPEIPVGFGQDVIAPSPQPKALAPISMDRSERLEALVDNSLAKAEELLNIALDPLDENFIKLASMQKDLVVSLVNTGVKVDENRFKKRQSDALTGILAGLIEREKTLEPLLTVTPVGNA